MIRKLISFVTVLSMLTSYGVAFAETEQTEETTLFELNEAAEATLTGDAEIIAEGNCGISDDNAAWTLTSDGVLTISGSGEMANYDTPPWYDYIDNIKKVVINDGITTIGNYAFWNCTSLSSVTIPKNVTTIGRDAFSGCTSLSSITVDDNNANYKSIDGVLFSKDGTELIQYPAGNTQTSYNIPESVTTIVSNSFSSSENLSSVTIPESVTTIGEMAFGNCPSLISVTIPESVATMSAHVFYDCTSLSSITVDDNNANYKSIDGILFSKDEKKLIIYPLEKKQTSYVIPDGVTEIGPDAFAYCKSLSSVTISEGVTTIGSRAFRNCTSLSSITIPKGVTKIGNYAFVYCTSLSSITIPEGVTEIGDYAFEFCTSLSSVTIPASVTAIGDYIFEDCSSDVEINGYTGSVAGIYAKKNNIKFKSLGQMPYLPPLETNVVILDSFKDKVNVTKFEDNGSVKFEAELLGGYDGDLTLYVAIYDSDGTLKEIEKASANQEEDKLIWNISKPDSKDLYKIMMWNNKNQPIIKAMK